MTFNQSCDAPGCRARAGNSVGNNYYCALHIGEVVRRYSKPPSAESLDASTTRLTKVLDKLESKPPAANASVAEFFSAVEQRLEAGQRAYGDKSFSRDPSELLGELEQEALDLAGWGYVLWCRVRAAKAAAQKAGL